MPVAARANAEEEAEEGRAGRLSCKRRRAVRSCRRRPALPRVSPANRLDASRLSTRFLVCAMWRERFLVALYLVRESSLRNRSFEGREKTVSERDYLAKEEALRRLSEPEGDHELHAALERMRESHPHLWEVPTELTFRATPTPPTWRSGERLPR